MGAPSEGFLEGYTAAGSEVKESKRMVMVQFHDANRETLNH
jgi:hypothetical protein